MNSTMVQAIFFAVFAMFALAVEAGISIHKVKGKCQSKYLGKKFVNDVTKPLTKDVERDQCMKCFCDKGGKSMTCFGCSPSYVTVDEQMALLEKRCYLTDAKEFPSFPMCCRNTVVCEEGVNSKYFSEESFKRYQHDLEPFVEMYKLLAYLKNARDEKMTDDVQDDDYYYQQQKKDTFQGELIEPSSMKTTDDSMFVLPSQKQESVDPSIFVGQSQIQKEVPIEEFVKPSQYQSISELPSLSREFGGQSFEEPEGQVTLPKAKPMKNLRKLYRNKPAPIILDEEVISKPITDEKAVRKAKMQRKFLRKLQKSKALKAQPGTVLVKTKPAPKVAVDELVKETLPRNVAFAPIPVFKVDDNVKTVKAKFAPIPEFLVPEPMPTERKQPSKAPKFAPIPFFEFDEPEPTMAKSAMEPKLAPIPDFEFDQSESSSEFSDYPTIKKQAPSSAMAPLPDYAMDLYSKDDKHTPMSPELGPSLLMNMEYLELPENFEMPEHS